jgi:hypothetical protein
MGEWTSEVEDILEKLRINCVNLSEYHRKRFYHFKSYGKWFRLPLIVLASINSTASVGLQPLMEQQIISGITCVIGMFMGIISAYELYLGIQTNMELEIKQSKDFYTLSIDLFKTLSLRRENRGEDGKDYLNKKYSHYIKLTEASNLLKRKLSVDTLTTIPQEFIDITPKGSDGGDEIHLSKLYSTPRPSYDENVLKTISENITEEMVRITEENDEEKELLKSPDIL